MIFIYSRVFKYHIKDTLGYCGRVLKYKEVPLELGKGLEEKYSSISKDWGHGKTKVGFERGSIG